MQQVANTVFYTCCTAADAKVQNFAAPGVALTAGTQCWVVVNANAPADTATEDVWDDGGGPTQGYQEGGHQRCVGLIPGKHRVRGGHNRDQALIFPERARRPRISWRI
jgi:hypothetical protein